MQNKAVVYLFHLYQPPWQTHEIFLKFFKESYEPLITLLENKKELKLTLNIIGALTEKLILEGKVNFINRIRNLVKKGQIELVGSAMYHPILPLIPEEHVVRQIQLNEEINNKYFKDEWKMAEKRFGKRGFFIPEIAYSYDVAKIIEGQNFGWITLDKSGLGSKEKVSFDRKYKLKDSNLNLLIRNSNITKEENKLLNYNVIIQDGEFELNENKDDLNWNRFFNDTWGENNYRFLTAGEYFQEINQEELTVNPNPSNWQMTEEEFKKKSFYHIWKNDEDEIHTVLWDFLYKILELHDKHKNDSHVNLSSKELDKALSSCTWWWVDGRFNGYDPTSITHGLNILINVVRSLEDLNPKEKIEFEKIYSEIIFKIWERHWVNFKKV